MMKKITNKMQRLAILLAITFAAFNVTAQSGWQQVYTGGGWIELITFVPGANGQWETGWAVTGSDDIIKTTDGGDTWTVYSQSEATWVNGIAFIDETTGFMCSANGEIVKSTDGGETWVTVQSVSGDWYGQMSFKDDMNGVIAGDPSLYTSDGGNTWLTATNNGILIDRVDYGGGDTYYSCGFLAMQLAMSTDNGASWEDNYYADEILDALSAYDENHAMTGGSAFTLIYTNDGGVTWEDHVMNGGSGSLGSVGYFDLDTAYAAGTNAVYKTTDGWVNFYQDTTMSAVNHRAMFVTPTNVVYLGGDPTQIWRKIGPVPLSPDFAADQTTVCSGTTINFTDASIGDNISSWSWSFPGGTPSSSTDEDPSIVYNTGGMYDVTLTIVDANGTESETKMDYITVNDIPAKADTPDGDSELCNDVFYLYTVPEVIYAETYEWELSPAAAGTLTSNGFEATLEADSDWTGDFTLIARASNSCGDGEWSDNFEGTINANPDVFTLQGGGTYCEGSDGVEITLDGSDSGIEYELFLDDVTTGITMDGTGSELSFGLLMDEGYYTATGSNGNCAVAMSEQILVEMSSLPIQAATPAGPVAICTETSSDYTSAGGEGADSYEWILYPTEAGTIIGTGLEATVNWDASYSGIATISLFGINDCGNGETSEELEVSVGAPAPVIDGEEMVCDFSTEIYTVTDNEGSTYAWIVTGGVITEGEGTYMITVAWNGEGNGTVMVHEETADGCEGSSEEFAVLIDDCTGIDEVNEANNISVYPNPADNYINLTVFSNKAESTKLVVTNLLGKVILEKDYQVNSGINNEQMDVSNLESGIYFISVRENANTIAEIKFIKK